MISNCLDRMSLGARSYRGDISSILTITGWFFFQTLITQSFLKISMFSNKLMKDKIGTFDNSLKRECKITNLRFFSINVRNARHLFGSKFWLYLWNCQRHKQDIYWNLGFIFLNDSLRAWLHVKMYVTLWMNLYAFFCENLDIFKNNEVLSVLQYDLHSFKIRQQSITSYLFEETKTLILPLKEEKRPNH